MTTAPIRSGQRSLARLTIPVLAALFSAASAAPAAAQGFGFGGQAVGGISIDAHGIVRNLDPEASQELHARRRELLARAGAPTGGAAPLRKVSLAGLCRSLAECSAQGRPLQPDVLFLGGLERVTHVFVDPDGHDIVLAGPADVPTIDPAGNVVAAASGRPLLQLEDLIVALRAIESARPTGIRCSIDPSPEGVVKLQRYLGSLKSIGANPEATLRAMENVLGPQKVTVGGVPSDSRMAGVLVAADYRLKRIGMGLEASGVAALPSYLSMVPAGATSGASLPRFWLEAEYDPIIRDADELAWQITGRRMKCLTESDVAAAGGLARGTAPTDKVAEAWCGALTANYDALCRKQPVFAELVNCVDLAVVAALISGRQLDDRAGLDLAPLRDATKLALPTYQSPDTLATVAVGFKRGNRWIVSASGGIQFQPWAFAANTSESGESTAARGVALAGRPADGWYWD